MAKELKNFTKRSDNYSQWYNELVVKADLAEQSAVRGCMVIKPDELGVGDVENALPDSAREILGGTGVMDTDAPGALERIFDAAMDALGGVVREVLRPVTGLMAVVLLCSCAQSLTAGHGGFDYINLAGCLGVAAISLGEVNSLLAMGRSVMTELTVF